MILVLSNAFYFFFNDTATTEIYTLSLHDALPIWHRVGQRHDDVPAAGDRVFEDLRGTLVDRKSTRLNSSHDQISYAVFCLKKKKHDFVTPCCTLPCTTHGPLYLTQLPATPPSVST